MTRRIRENVGEGKSGGQVRRAPEDVFEGKRDPLECYVALGYGPNPNLETLVRSY